VAAIVDIGGFVLLSSARVPIIMAAACSFIAATVVNYLLTSRFVFCEIASLRRYAVFLTGTLTALVVNVLLTSSGIFYFGLPRGGAKTIAVGATFFLSFWINARVVFRNKSPRSPAIPA
jgi:putative flippase GtrA